MKKFFEKLAGKKKDDQNNGFPPPDHDKTVGPFEIAVAFAAVAAAGTVVAAGLQHGMQGYEAHRERDLKRRAQERKRNKNNRPKR